MTRGASDFGVFKIGARRQKRPQPTEVDLDSQIHEYPNLLCLFLAYAIPRNIVRLNARANGTILHISRCAVLQTSWHGRPNLKSKGTPTPKLSVTSRVKQLLRTSKQNKNECRRPHQRFKRASDTQPSILLRQVLQHTSDL